LLILGVYQLNLMTWVNISMTIFYLRIDPSVDYG